MISFRLKGLTFVRIAFAVGMLFAFQACNTDKEICIVLGEHAGKTEQLTASHLKADLEEVLGRSVQIRSEKELGSISGQILLMGTPASHSSIAKLAAEKVLNLSKDFPGSRGGIWAGIRQQGQRMAVLAGSDVQGMQYAVYQYCREILGVDPFAYWSGKSSELFPGLDVLDFPDRVIEAPEIPILCYFENDVDELANIKSPKLEYDWQNYTEMINSLVRLKYNAIQLFDMLGRPEFFLRPEYQLIRPGYDIRLSYIDSLITYAQDMGMMVQVDMALGYKIRPMAQEKADCWKRNKQDWIDTWIYYLEDTPLGKADIFSLRPRNQVWDWEYKSSCGEEKIEVFNEVCVELGALIDRYKPEATKVLICYHDGMEMFNQGFGPPDDWIIAWSDDGYAEFAYWPQSTRGYDFGTYMHAGFWLNHTVHDPYPERIDFIMKRMLDEYGANKYCMVNGQQFRPFLLNLEAFSKAADDIAAFNGAAFYRDWARRYFGEEAGKYAVRSMKKLHEAQFDRVGYVQHLWEIREAVSYLSNAPLERPGKDPIPHDYRRVENDYEHVARRFALLKEALEEALKGYEIVSKDDHFYHDYILYPVQMYADLLEFELVLHQMAKDKKAFEDSGNGVHIEKALEALYLARRKLEVVHEACVSGDKNPRWKGWYLPENRRPNNGFPTQEMLKLIEHNLEHL
jgi:hypothetical protein